MGQFGKIKSLLNLPCDDILIWYIREAILLNDQGIKSRKIVVPEPGNQPLIPEDFTEALDKTLQAMFNFKNFSQSQKKVCRMDNGR